MSRQVPVHADALMRAVHYVEEFSVKLHFFDRFSCDSLLLEVTLESLEESTVMRSVYCITTMHPRFVQIINRACEL